MSSSDPQLRARRFLRVFAAAFPLAGVLLLVLCWLSDPTGLLRQTGLSPGLCADGIATSEERFVKPLLIPALRPEEVILGSSRVASGFRAEPFGGRRIANLALRGATLAEVDGLARQAIDSGHVRRIWIGLDFGPFISPYTRHRETLRLPAGRQSPRWIAVRHGLFDRRAIRSALSSTLADQGCDRPFLTMYGFLARPANSRPTDEANRRIAALVEDEWDESPARRHGTYRQRLHLFRRLLAHARRRGVAVVAFVGPASRHYQAALARAGLVDEYRRWRTDVRSLVEAQEGIFVATEAPGFLAPVRARLCGQAPPPDCLFMDATHFRPEIGDLIVRAALSGGRGRRPS